MIIRGGKTPVLYDMSLWVKKWICLVLFKIPIAICYSWNYRWNTIVPPSPDGSSVLLGNPCQSPSLIVVSEAYWGNLLRAVIISYLRASSFSPCSFQVPATGVP